MIWNCKIMQGAHVTVSQDQWLKLDKRQGKVAKLQARISTVLSKFRKLSFKELRTLRRGEQWRNMMNIITLINWFNQHNLKQKFVCSNDHSAKHDKILEVSPTWASLACAFCSTFVQMKTWSKESKESNARRSLSLHNFWTSELSDWHTSLSLTCHLKVPDTYLIRTWCFAVSWSDVLFDRQISACSDFKAPPPALSQPCECQQQSLFQSFPKGNQKRDTFFDFSFTFLTSLLFTHLFSSYVFLLKHTNG